MSAKLEIDDSFNIRPYLRSLSHRELFTCLSLALLFVAVTDAIEWAADNTRALKIAIFVTFTIGNHVFYKLEHRRPNNFAGRNIHDYIFLTLVVLITKVKMWILGYDITFGSDIIGGAVGMIVIAIILVILLELLVAGLKRILTLTKWQIM